MKVITIMFRVG